MVAKVISGKSISGALNYNEQKVKEGIAQCLHASRFGCKPDLLNFCEKLNRFENLIEKNKRTKTNAIHISLNFDKSETLDKETLTQIASVYMDKIGFGNQPYLVYEHKDAAHPHIHIVTTNIQADGKRIDIHNIGRNQSEQARKEIEKAFKLVQADSRKQEEKQFIHPVDVEKAVYGKSETKRSISNVVRMVTKNYKYASLPELNAVLRQYNVTAYRGEEGSQMYKKKGLIYSLLDDKGNRIGIPVKASSIYDKPTLAFLEKQFDLNKALKQPYKSQLKQKIDNALKVSAGREDFSENLKRAGVFVFFRENSEGRIYGVTFIDAKNKVVFNGSSLGKQYGAKGILQTLEAPIPASKGDWPETAFKPGGETEKASPGKDLDLGVDQLLLDLMKAESIDYLSPKAAMKLRKKKRKRRGRSL